MAWVLRGNREFYYRSVYTGGKSCMQYVGAGPVAQLAASYDQLHRARRLADKQSLAELRRHLQAVDARLAELTWRADLLGAASLICAGYHRRGKCSWSRRHVR